MSHRQSQPPCFKKLFSMLSQETDTYIQFQLKRHQQSVLPRTTTIDRWPSPQQTVPDWCFLQDSLKYWSQEY
jgi:hypothetical protein